MNVKPDASGTSSGSATVSQDASMAASPFGAFSWGISAFVMPISIAVASPEKLSTVAICDFQPKRPARSGLDGEDSSGSTQCTRPEMPSPLASVGSSFAAIAASGIASMRPNAIDEFVMRTAVTVASTGIVSRQGSLIASDWRSEPPSSSSGKNSPFSSMPKRVTEIEPQPPTGFEWQLWQFDLLKIGPRPVAFPNGVTYDTRPAVQRAS